jgi:hypothetical protein
MFLTILGIAFVVIVTFFVHKNAVDYGRNAIIWALITFFTGITLQWLIPIVFMVFLMFFWTLTGSSLSEAQDTLRDYSFLISIGGLILSVIMLFLILKIVSKMPEEKDFNKPPLPPTFS